ncbi:MarR family winged helix-turn-helix transcriptional regulator [Gordonia soli]|uniref:Putative MarR family transcriptional regulator n=1 Tax=Gordonia soli NBRC 108243 TaxID=1223545 RepID=M0QN10_9ACTN|nr:MarR family transcriptional regulator [Gordonia soli]GAC70050.1 putative MarR family transcriptional regulator [Gordonia soli NBRC 108243]
MAAERQSDTRRAADARRGATADPAREVADSIRTVVWALRRYGERQAGLTALPNSELEVLRTVAERPECTVSEIARLLGLQTSNVSTSVRHLMAKGLLERTVDPADRRSARLAMTAEARRHAGMIDDVWSRAIGDQLSQMTADEVRTLVDAAPLLRRIARLPEQS